MCSRKHFQESAIVMALDDNKFIPVVLVTGFLGSGKTTFLRHIINTYRDRPLAYLVNEFSPLDIDGRLLAEEDLKENQDSLTVLPGGSIFCTCLVTEFVKALTDIPEKSPHPVEGVVIEASGVANPMVIEQLIKDTGLDGLYRLSAVITLADPDNLIKLLPIMTNMTEQIRAADVVLLNKADVYDDDIMERAERMVRDIRPDARVLRTTHADIALDVSGVDLFGLRTPTEMTGPYATCADPAYGRFVVRTSYPLSMEKLLHALQEAKDFLYRCKGNVHAEEGDYYLDYSTAALVTKPAVKLLDSTEFVMITRGDAFDQAKSLVNDIKAGFGQEN